MNLLVIILAAGAGTRMCSSATKVMHELAGRPILQHIIATSLSLQPREVIAVCSSQANKVHQLCAANNITVAIQQQQLGTADAVQAALTTTLKNSPSSLSTVDKILVLNGDVPLITKQSLVNLINITKASGLSFISANVANPEGLGRVVRDTKTLEILEIVEHKDASQQQLAITEINAGIYCFAKNVLEEYLGHITSSNKQQEKYLPDLIKIAKQNGLPVSNYKLPSKSNNLANGNNNSSSWEIQGINNMHELAIAERLYQQNLAKKFMVNHGVKIIDPSRIDIRGEVTIGKDVVIDINAILIGKVIIKNNVYIGPNVTIKNSTIDEGTVVAANSVIEDAIIGKLCKIGPFARVRPGTIVEAQAKIGNFVEVKKSIIGEFSKINHLSYIGDTDMGKNCNIGAGTITCNYDGANKHKTIIKNNVFIGSNCELVAPITIKQLATVAAGTTVIKDTPENSLILNVKQTKYDAAWQRPYKLGASLCVE